ncbi:MAG TPA: BTAD domain-containing putative transcriptional regulator [Nocardioidaceae bacterium]|nr:BTAD domain-containing putative transcriptional regulator [Nocardioidaceae bacterium]
MRIELLGPLVIDGGAGKIGPRDRVVLAALAVRPGEVSSADRLADALWGDQPPASSKKVVQGCVARLRQTLGSETIETLPQGYRLLVTSDDVDTLLFERRVGRGRELLTVGESERASYVLGQALDLWRGPAFVDLDGWDPGRVEAGRLDELRLDSEELRLDASLRAGHHLEVLAQAQEQAIAAPMRERRWGLLALAQYQAGRQAEALRTLHRVRTVLAKELGLDPSPDLVALEQAILQQDPSLLVEPALSEPSAVCPYRGLMPYDIDDADSFFGRDGDLAACLERLSTVGVLAVVGPSGSGKSSLVRAGVAAIYRRDGHRTVVVSPGAHPMDALTAIPDKGPTPLLVVDQLEEAFSLCEDRDERVRFFATLTEHAANGRLVVALRADRMGEVSAYPDVSRLIERGLYLLGAMTEDDLRAAIEGPARQAGLPIESGLVDLLVREVEGEPGALPLLSHALRETWLRREGRTLTVAGYQATGGIRGAVAQSAEDVYERVDADQRDAFRDLLLRLVIPTEAGEPVRSRLPRRLVATDHEREQLIELLVAARLVTSDDGVIEVTHEALARAWPRLREWLDEDVGGQRIRHHLTVAADVWEEMDRPNSELYRGARLAQAAAWRDTSRPGLTEVELDFLEASLAREASDLRAAQTQIRRERRTVRRLRWLTAAVAALAVLAGAAWLVAVDQRQRADERSTEAEARRASALALVEPSYDRALLLAVEGVHLWDSPETRGNLLNTIQRSPSVAGVIRGEGARLMDLELAPDGERAVVVDNLEDVTTYDLADRAPVATLGGEGTSYRAATFSPDGSQVAVSWFDTDCWIGGPQCRFGVTSYDAQTLESTGVTYRGLGNPAADVTYSPRGDLIAAIGPLPFDDKVAVWQIDRPDKPMMRLNLSESGSFFEVTPERDLQGWVTFSPDGRRLYAGGAGPTDVFDLTTGDRVGSLDGAGALALSPGGETLAVRTRGAGVRLIDTTTGRSTAELSGHESAVTGAAFSHDGSLIATVSNDQTAIVWNAATGEAVQNLRAHVGSVHAVEFGQDLQDMQLYTAGADGTTIVWDLDRTRGLAQQLVPPGPANPPDEGAPLLSPGATSVLFQGEPRLLDVGTGATTPLPIDGEDLAWAAYRPDGRRVATVSSNGAVQLWDVETGERVDKASGRGDNLGAIAYTPDGAHIVVAEQNGLVRELDAHTLEPTGRTLDLDLTPVGVRTTHDGLIAVTAESADIGAGTDVVLADLDDGRVMHQVHISSWGVRANFSADGRLYAYGGFDGRVGVIDVATGKEIARTRDPIHDGPVSWVTFSPDSETLVSVGFDGQAILSDPSSVVPFARVQPGEPTLRSTAAYLDDGHTLVLAYADESVISLETDPAAWEAHACAVAGRNLTSDEWAAAFPDRDYRQTCIEN